MDVHTPEQRSKNMRAIKATGTKDEIRLAKALWHSGYRYRKNDKTVFGKPDLVFKKHKVAIFVDSDFFSRWREHLARDLLHPFSYRNIIFLSINTSHFKVS